MCNIPNEMNEERLDGRTPEEAYPRQYKILPLDQVEKGVCPASGEELSGEYLSSGQCPKAFAEHVYQGIINNPGKKCKLCRTGLSKQKIEGQSNSNREIINHFCPECVEYLALVYRKISGIPIPGQSLQITYEPIETISSMMKNNKIKKRKPVKVRAIRKSIKDDDVIMLEPNVNYA